MGGTSTGKTAEEREPQGIQGIQCRKLVGRGEYRQGDNVEGVSGKSRKRNRAALGSNLRNLLR